MDVIYVLLIGIGSSYLASWFFLQAFLNRKRPVIEVSGYISKIQFKGETNYLFKFINKTGSEIFDVRIEPTFYKPFGDFNGSNLIGKDIDLKDNFCSYLPCDKEEDIHNLHAIRVRTTEDLEGKWTDESSFIRLTVIAKHSLSGLNKVYVKDFLSKDCITTQKFLSGNDLGVK